MDTYANTNSFEINKNDLILIIGESMGDNSRESLKLAHQLGSGGKHGQVLFINSYQRPHKFMLTLRQALGSGYDIQNNRDNLTCLSSVAGDLLNASTTIESKLKDGVSTVLINGWELIARDSRLKEKLLYTILGWMHVYSITVILYAQKSSSIPKVGHLQRGGFGKLAGVADLVVKNYSDEPAIERPVNESVDDTRTENIPDDLVYDRYPEESVIEDHKPDDTTDEDHDVDIEEVFKGKWRDSRTIGWQHDEGESYFRTSHSASGYREFHDLVAHDHGFFKKEVDLWKALSIPPVEPKVYFPSKPDASRHYTLVYEFRTIGKNLWVKTAKISFADYHFPPVIPLAENPVRGMKLEAYLEQYRVGNSENVKNDVVIDQGVTDQVLKRAA